MTGIRDPKKLQEAFGPPDMGRVWRTVTLFDVRRFRQPQGWLMSSDIVDYACLGIVALAIFVSHPFVGAGLVAALVIQVAGWIVSFGLPK